ncbi:MAG: AAA family ATPase [Planctomycetes bacterium]|nr:AAA family ATPase [Planctomycetota bacterium]
MADPRKELQADFAASTRFERYGEVLMRMRIQGFRNHTDTTISIESPILALCGVNGTGKSTVLQLAASAYKCKERYYVSTFILVGGLPQKPFRDDASVEFFYAAQPGKDGAARVTTNTVSRSGDSWAGYDRQPDRHVRYIGTGFYVPHSERSAESRSNLKMPNSLRVRESRSKPR